MDSLGSTVKRIRWIPVLSVLLVVLIIALLIIAIPSKYSVEGKVGLSVSAKPDKIDVGERSEITIEIKNLDENSEKTINVDAETFDQNFLFVSTESRKASKYSIVVGPEEERKISLDVRATQDALPGKYRVDVTAREKGYADGSKDTAYIKVSKD